MSVAKIVYKCMDVCMYAYKILSICMYVCMYVGEEHIESGHPGDSR